MTAPLKESPTESEFTSVHHLYTRHRVGLPPLRNYLSELWHRRAFAVEMSRATMRSDYMSTFFGQAWLILNPLLLAGIYYLLITIIRGSHNPALFVHLTLGLFAFSLVSSSLSSGASAVVNSGRLLVNTAFPRLLLTLSVVRTAFLRFLPTIPVYIAFHIIFGLPFHPRMLLSLYFLATMMMFATGLAAFFGALQVRFRDTTKLLPYLVRIWMYVSPILWMPERIGHLGPTLSTVIQFNPMFAMLGGYTELIQEGIIPSPFMWISSGIWGVTVLIIGCLFFISREREFAIQLD